MKLAIFSSKKWVKDAFTSKKPKTIEQTFFEARLDEETAALAAGYDAICVFVNDVINAAVIDTLAKGGVKIIALRCAGFNNVDLHRAEEKGIKVCRVPAYSPYAVAEYALGLILTLNRKYHRAHSRVREGNFSLDGLLGFDLHKKTVGIIGTGKIGQVFMNVISGLGVKVLAYDKFPSDTVKEKGVKYVDLETLYRESDIISLHCPLNHETYHLINDYAIKSMKKGVMLINTSRGPLINSNAVIDGLKSGIVGYVGLDVYEEEGDLFFEDLSDEVIQDDTFVRLQTFPNVLITSHQAFFTREAVENIKETTYSNLIEIEKTGSSPNLVALPGK
ncbi:MULTISPECIES: 2-hydroxyacid dehydrogenase [unclassified Oceanispirochaeta]|uniref:2-hydroxyacid dehydrogenase n=1 Tax=unclassified Oceanispirochaeta TaxID=2635722 RepID=UPI000E09300A|nr:MULTISPECIES: 2-hydroxyacid dehydrogenase [unclassified Oceanispirochaeta]MBF9017372.1 2-hydroxyacid dehydrogenase [Oceanispirochaeta sp. M2]NPD73747.1 2-hydroxyacid dehydrogenase [Oceanispirochaeta sp. M1]RDG30499.1 2-hydroxyacid dehydrogenase [Oceanispirochaeta sp. M1]